MELFGKQISKKEAVEGAGITAVAAALITAVALWGNKDLTLGVSLSSKDVCQDSTPRLVKNSDEAISAITTAEYDLVARLNMDVGSPAQLAAGEYALKLLTKKGSTLDHPRFKAPDAGELICQTDTKAGNRPALTPKAESIVDDLSAAGIEVNFDS